MTAALRGSKESGFGLMDTGLRRWEAIAYSSSRASGVHDGH